MRKKILMSLLVCIVLCSVGCGDNDGGKKSNDEVRVSTTEASDVKDESKELEDPTGYPDGEVQRMYVYYEKELYVYDGEQVNIKETDVTSRFSGFEKIGSVSGVSNKEMPNEELEASRCSEQAVIYTNSSDKTKVLLYDDGNVYMLNIDK